MSVDTRRRAYDWEDQEATVVAGLHQDGLAVLHAIACVGQRQSSRAVHVPDA